jgi:LysM repeat protein
VIDLCATPLPLPPGQPTPTERPARTTWTTYTVAAGDSYFSIAARFNVTQAAIAAANNLPTRDLGSPVIDPGAIYVGQVLQIPPSNWMP